jgi:hypothetical protein
MKKPKEHFKKKNFYLLADFELLALPERAWKTLNEPLTLFNKVLTYFGMAYARRSLNNSLTYFGMGIKA